MGDSAKGTWTDTWQHNGQGGELICTLTAGEGNEVRAEFKAPGFLKDGKSVVLKLKADGDGFATSGSAEMGKAAGTLTFKARLSADKFTGEYDSADERGKFELKKK